MVEDRTNAMFGINSYGRELTKEEIADNLHRDFVGGLWQELGQLQFDFLQQFGLQPHHKLLDLGCGSLRGGIHFIKYLDRGNYYGMDINASLIEAAKVEVKEASLEDKAPHLLVSDRFAIEQFDEKFDFVLSISLFTHLPANNIIRCLAEVSKNLKNRGKYLATFFIAPRSVYLDKLLHQPGDVVTNYDRDPFHYSLAEITSMANLAGLKVNLIGDWNHPRNQQMVEFSLLDRTYNNAAQRIFKRFSFRRDRNYPIK